MKDTPQRESNGATVQLARNHLSLLVRLRWLAIAGQIVAIGVTNYVFNVTLPVREMMLVVAFLAFLNLSATWRLRRLTSVTEISIIIELLLDVMCLTIQLYLSGGASNPFVTLFILQVILALTLLSKLQAILILAAAVAAHYWLLGNGLPLGLPHHHSEHGAGPSFLDLHLQGMFVSFVLTAGLLSWFVAKTIENLRRRDEQVALLNQQIAEEDILVRMGLLASGAAHELGTPLTTLSVNLEDWKTLGLPEANQLRQQLDVMLVEITRCRRIVSDLLTSSGVERLDEAEEVDAASYVRDLARSWQEETSGEVRSECRSESSARIVVGPMLEQAIRQLLDNAVEADATQIQIFTRDHMSGQLEIEVTDNGHGFSAAALDRLGQPYASDKAGHGRGLGLFLVGNVMRRIGGSIRAANSVNGGAAVSLFLPCHLLEQAA